ncbi:hypothetical protein D3C80_1908170 [compost metagenome]
MTSENSSVPAWAYSAPFSSSRVTLALPFSCFSAPLASSCFRRRKSLLDWVTSTYIGSSCCTVDSAVVWPLVTNAPSVTADLPMRPEIGEVTLV